MKPFKPHFYIFLVSCTKSGNLHHFLALRDFTSLANFAQKVGLIIFVGFSSYAERPRADFVLAFVNFLKNFKITDKNLFSAQKSMIFQVMVFQK